MGWIEEMATLVEEPLAPPSAAEEDSWLREMATPVDEAPVVPPGAAEQQIRPPRQKAPEPRKIKFEDTVYNFSPEYDDKAIERELNRVAAPKRQLTPEQLSSRAQPYDTEEQAELRRKTPMGQKGVEEWAEYFSGEDDEGKPIVVKPEELTPQAMEGAVESRKEFAAEFEKMPNVNPVALRHFKEDTAAMERELERRFPTESKLQYYARNLLRMDDEEVMDLAKWRGIEGVEAPKRQWEPIAVRRKRLAKDAEQAREKLLEAYVRDLPENVLKRVGHPKKDEGWVDWAIREARDLRTAAMKGSVGLAQTVTGLANMIPVTAALPGGGPGGILPRLAEAKGYKVYGAAGKIQEWFGIDHKKTQEILQGQYSQELQRSQQKVAEAKGLLGKLDAAIEDPSVITTTVVESLPSMFLGGGVIGAEIRASGLLPKILGKYAPAAVGEGVVSAGATAEGIRGETEDGMMSERQAAIAAGSGVATGLIGLLGAKLSNKLGVDDIDTLMAGTANDNVKRGILYRALAGALVEGGFEESQQSIQEQIAENVATGKPWHEGWDQAAVMGALSGAVMGAGAQLGPSRLAKIDEKVKSGGHPSRTEAAELGIPEPEARSAKGRREWYLENRDRLRKEAEDASQVREDQGVPEETGEVGQGSEADRGRGVQQAPETGREAGEQEVSRVEGEVYTDTLGVRVKDKPVAKGLDAGIADHVQTINDAGFTTIQSMSGLKEDYPTGERYSPDGYMAFMRDDNSPEQLQQIREAAEAAGLPVKDSEIFFQPAVVVRTGMTNDGTPLETLRKQASQAADKQYPDARGTDAFMEEWLPFRDQELRRLEQEHGGRLEDDAAISKMWADFTAELTKKPDGTTQPVPAEVLAEYPDLVPGKKVEAEEERNEGIYGFGYGTEDLPNASEVSRTEWLEAYIPRIQMGLPKPLEAGDFVSLGTAFEGGKNPFAPDSPLMKTMQRFAVDADVQSMNWADGIMGIAEDAAGKEILRSVANDIGLEEQGIDAIAEWLQDPPIDDYKKIADSLAPKLEAFVKQRGLYNVPYGVRELLETAKALRDPLEYAIQVWEQAQEGKKAQQPEAVPEAIQAPEAPPPKSKGKKVAEPAPEAMEFEAGQAPPVSEQKVEEAEKPATERMKVGDVVQVPTETINVDPGRFQFKTGISKKTGVVEGEELQGDWDPLAAGIVLLWEDKAGKLWVVNGHHRADLAKRKHVPSMTARIVRESDGVSEGKARAMGAKLNILEGQGKVEDYADFFRASEISESEATREGLLARAKGKTGFLVGRFASDDVWAGYRGRKISAEKAAAIADIGRGDDRLQAAGLNKAKNMSADELRHFLGALKHYKPTPKARQGDLFGFDDSAILEAEKISKAVSEITSTLKDRLLAVQGALKRPETAKKMGLAGDFDAIQAEVERIREDLDQWDHWTTNPELVRQARKKAGLDDDGGDGGDKGVPDDMVQKTVSEPEGKETEAEKAQRVADESRSEAKGWGFGFGGREYTTEPLREDTIDDSIKAPPAIERRLNKAHGIKKPPVMQRVRDTLSHLKNVTRAQEHIPNTKEFASANEFFRLLRNITSQVSDEAIRTVASITNKLGPKQLRLFERYAIMENLSSSIKSGQPLRFGFKSEAEVESYRAHLQTLVDRTPDVKEALETRQKIVRETVDKLVEYKLIPKETRDHAVSYYHQQVHMYAEAQRKAGQGKRVGKISRPFQRKRVRGDELADEMMDYNTSYLEAEISWLTDAYAEIEKERLLQQMMDRENILPELKGKAKRQNFVNVVGGPKIANRIDEILGELKESRASEDAQDSAERMRRKALIEELEEIDPTHPYRKQIAKMSGWFRREHGLEGEDYEEDSQFWDMVNEAADKGDVPALAFFKALQAREKFIKQILGNNYETWESLAEKKEGWEVVQPEPGNMFYQAFTIPERIAEMLKSDAIKVAELTEGDLRQVLAVGGPRRQFVVRSEVAAQIRDTRKGEPAHGLAIVADEAMRAWKVWSLLGPKRVLSYWLRNLTGDIEPVVAADPRLLSQWGKAAVELGKYYSDHLHLSEEMRVARDHGVIGSGFTAQEVPDIKDMKIFQRLFPERKGKRFRPIKSYWDTVKQKNEWREDSLRYAAFLGYRDQLRKGRVNNYGGSNKAVVETIKQELGVDAAAAHLARNLLGDYGNISVAGNWIRRRLMPFWSFQEINLKRVPRLVANAWDSGGAMRAGGVLTAAAGRAILLSRIAWLYAGLWAWNNLIMGGDEEDELTGFDRATPHVILGRNPDGSIRIFRRVGALGDFLEWFGITEALSMYGKYQERQVNARDILEEMAFATPDKTINSLRPDLKALFEVTTGQSLFPEPFQPRSARRGENVSHIFGLSDEYRLMKGWALDDGTSVRPHYWQRFLYGVVDPRQAALSNIYDSRNDFLKQKGKEQKGVFPVSRYKEARDAAMNEDYGAFSDWKRKYVSERGDNAKDDFNQWLRTLDPIGNRLNDSDEYEFEHEFLSSEQRQRLKVARNYAHELRDMLVAWWDADEKSYPMKKAVLYSAFNRMITKEPKREEFGSDEEYRKKVTSYIISNRQAANDILSMASSHAEAQLFLANSFRKLNNKGDKETEFVKRKRKPGEKWKRSKLKDSYIDKATALAELYGKTFEDVRNLRGTPEFK